MQNQYNKNSRTTTLKMSYFRELKQFVVINITKKRLFFLYFFLNIYMYEIY
jgi:hypothetical protein